jgi:hypothetical protein
VGVAPILRYPLNPPLRPAGGPSSPGPFSRLCGRRGRGQYLEPCGGRCIRLSAAQVRDDIEGALLEVANAIPPLSRGIGREGRGVRARPVRVRLPLGHGTRSVGPHPPAPSPDFAEEGEREPCGIRFIRLSAIQVPNDIEGALLELAYAIPLSPVESGERVGE